MPNPTSVRAIVLCTLAAAAVTRCAPATHRALREANPSIPSRSARAEAPYLRLPLRFEPTADDESAFVAHGHGFALMIASDSATFALRSGPRQPPIVVQMHLEGARSARVSARRPLAGSSNYLLGPDRSAWRIGVPGYAEVESADVYPGVDVVFYGNQRTLEYDFHVAPGGDPSVIQLRFDAPVTVDRGGQLVIATPAGDLIQHAPVVYQLAGGTRRTVDGAYVERANGTIGFDIGAYDRSAPLVIDPLLTYSTFLGGSMQERGEGVAIDPAGNIVVAGTTFSDDFPTANASQPVRAGSGDLFVAKITADGSALIYATYIGGVGYDEGHAVATDAAGAAYVVGQTYSYLFPATHFLNAGLPAFGDVVVVKLEPSGALAYATLLGGLLGENGNGIAVDAFGRAHVAGWTESADFPTVGAQQPALAGYPAFRSTDGTLTWTGIRDGLVTESTRSLAFDASTRPTTMYAGTDLRGAFKSVDGGVTWTHPANANLSRVSIMAMAVAAGSPASLYAATGAGVFRSDDGAESWTDLNLPAEISSIVVSADAGPTIYAGTRWGWPDGVMRSTDGGMTWNPTGLGEGVTMLAASGSTIYAATSSGRLYRTTDGTSWTDVGPGIPSGELTVAVSPDNPDRAWAGNFDGLFATTDGGATWTPVFTSVAIAAILIAPSQPSTIYVFAYFGDFAVSHDRGMTWGMGGHVQANPFGAGVDPASPGTVFVSNRRAWDAFVATLGADGSTLEQSTYFGGSNFDLATSIALDTAGATYIAGETFSDDLPVRSALQAARGGLNDVFVAKLSPAGTTDYATYLGGYGADYGARIAVDMSGRAYVAGLTWSNNFPVFNAAQGSMGGGYSDAFVSALAPTGDRFLYSTYLGGSAMENDSTQSIGPAIVVTAAGDAFVTGSTQSSDFPITADALQSARPGGATDAFLTSYNAVGAVQYSTYFGGAGADYPRAIASNDGGGVVVVGWTDSSDFPIVRGVQSVYAGSEDAFVARVAPGSPVTFDSLMAAVRAYASSGAIQNSKYRGLMAKLDDAKTAYDRGNLQAARAKLHDFIDQCAGSSGTGIDPAAADVLIADARRLLQTLEQ